MDHLKIELTATGDAISAISKATDIAKAIKEDLYLKFPSLNYSLRVHQDSNKQDLIEIIGWVDKSQQSKKQ